MTKMYWQLFKLFVLTFAPYVPMNPRVIRVPNATKFQLVVECTGFESIYQVGTALVKENQTTLQKLRTNARVFYTETLAAKLLEKKGV
jgi:hypothetical protein